MNITIEDIKALDGKITKKLTPDEEKTLDFCREQGRKVGVNVNIINTADPMELGNASSIQQAHQILKAANSIIKITIPDED